MSNSLHRVKIPTILVEGNIASGKSTCLQYIADRYPQVQEYLEPINLWRDCQGINLLDKFYQSPQQYSFMFQTYILLSRLEQHNELPPEGKIKVMERSLFSGPICFVEILYRTGKITDTEYLVLNESTKCAVKSLLPTDFIVLYIRADPHQCYDRLRQRSRPEEMNVDLTYLERLHELHDDWLLRNASKFGLSFAEAPFVIDANTHIPNVYEQCDNVFKRVISSYATVVSDNMQ